MPGGGDPTAVKPVSEWDYHLIPLWSGGMDIEGRPDLIKSGDSVLAQNLRIDKQSLLIDGGYKTFGPVVEGVPRKDVQFNRTNGTTDFVLVTNTRFYVWSSSAGEWQYVSDGTTTQADGGEPAGETSIAVDSEVGFSATDPIGLTLDDGSQHRTTVASTSSNTIVIDDGIPVGRTLENNATIVKATVLTGIDGEAVSWDIYAPNDWFIFSNNVDPPKRFDGTTCEDIPNLPSSGNTICKIIRVFNNHVVLFNTTEGGTSFPQRVRWCDTADPGDWSTGNAGTDEMYQTEGEITACEGLGPFMVIYKTDAVIRMDWLGEVDQLFFFEDRITGTGALGPDCVIPRDDEHVAFGNTKIYTYDGGYSTDDRFSRKVQDVAFGVSGDLSASNKDRTFCFYVKELNEDWFVYPSEAATMPNKVLRFNRNYQAWTIRTFSEEMSGYGVYKREDSPAWQDLIGSWSEQTWKWNSSVLDANVALIHLMGYADKQVFEYDFITPTDDGSDIPWEWETGDFEVVDRYLRHNKIDMRVRGTNITALISDDGGENFDTLGSGAFSPGARYKRVEKHKQLVSPRFRYRLSGDGGGFGVRWVGIQLKTESEWGGGNT